MKDLLLISHIFLWILVVGIGILMFAVMRQVGSLLLRAGGTRPFGFDVGPDVGDAAPWVPPYALEGRPKKPKFLAFLSTSCGACDALVPALNAVSRSYSDAVDVYVIAEEPAEAVERWSSVRELRAPILSAPEAFASFGIDGTPYGFALAADDTIAAKGGINHVEHVEMLLGNCVSGSTSGEESEEPEKISLLAIDSTVRGSNG